MTTHHASVNRSDDNAADSLLEVRNLQIVDGTCHFITDSPSIGQGDVTRIVDCGSRSSRRVRVVAVAESRLTHKKRSFCVARLLEG